MTLFNNNNFNNHEQVTFCHDHHTNLKAIIAVHNTQLGPAIGGCRVYPYASEEDALTDALRLSRGMTYKSAMANINLGGGKAVIIGDPKQIVSEPLFRVFGRFVDRLNGLYITAEDMGSNTECMAWINQETDHVVGLPTHLGGLGDPSPVTAYGIFTGMKAALKQLKGQEDLNGIKVAVQGIGHVGYHVCKELYNAGAKLFVSDINEKALKRVADEFKAVIVPTDELYDLDIDIYSPCALGATINDETIPRLKCSIIAGSANNQLKDEMKHGQALKEKNILYTPDYVINAGGLINVYAERNGNGEAYAKAKTEEIYPTLLKIFQLATEKQIPTSSAANQVAEKRLQDITEIKRIFNPNETE